MWSFLKRLYLSWKLILKKKLSETMPFPYEYKMGAIASSITSSHNFQSRSDGLSLQEFPFIRKKQISHKPQHTSLQVPLVARTRSHIYSPNSHSPKRHQWLAGSKDAGARKGYPSLSTCCPNLNQTGLLSSKSNSEVTTARTTHKIFHWPRIYGFIQHLSLCKALC